MRPDLLVAQVAVIATAALATLPTIADQPGEKFSSLRARSIGPALMSGRIGDFAVNPANPAEWYVAVCSGNVWKTTNNGTTFEPIFDNYGSYSIGCLALDPNDPNVIWVGTGENNSQRSVSYGDGVYVSRDAGKSFKHVGLKESEHIGMIAIDPRDSNVVYVAAQGPLWRSGGDRGLYKTTDGGKTWERILHISNDTGINEIHLDPRDPDTMYASAYQRRRHVWTLINGGPESGIHKSTDGGKTWRELTSGIPGEDKGRIGMDISPANPDVLYAIVEAEGPGRGVYRSDDKGERWTKRSGYMSSSPQYYNELVCHPHDVDTLFSLDTRLQKSTDGAASFSPVPDANRHVDYHALWINPEHPNHWIIGCDGGVYQTWDGSETSLYAANLPVTQFYRVAVDNSEPFYYVYGGTQDNNTQGGPSRTTDRAGITNADWFITVGGDGFETVVDPENPDIVYSQWQYGGLVRYDRASGETVDIRPRETPEDPPFVWNWDSPLIISPHSHSRLYYGGNFVFRSDDYGNNWERISGDMSRGIDRNQLEVMGVRQKPDAVAKDDSTSIYGNTVSISESPLVEDLLYVGTDDGLIHVTDDAGDNWRTIEAFPGIPHLTYVTWLCASQHNEDRVYACFDNHKMGDFTPYLLRSDDRGRTWDPVVGDLPERGTVHVVAEDHEDEDILFVGTEFGAHFTVDGGEHWHKIGGLPTIAVEDIELQRRENDVVMATFGRGFYILDDYSPIRHAHDEGLEEDAFIFPIKDAWLYVERSRLGGRGGKGWQGQGYYNAPNPPFGATITYNISKEIKTLEEQRREREKGKEWEYPTLDELSEEDRQRAPQFILTIRDDKEQVVRRIPVSRSKGLHRVTWDLRYPSPWPSGTTFESSSGKMALPGTYTASLSLEDEGEITEMAGPVEFDVVPLGNATFAAEDREEVFQFQAKVGRLLRAVTGANRALDEAQTRVDHVRAAIVATPDADQDLLADVERIHEGLHQLRVALQGDRAISRRNAPQVPSISSRVNSIVFDQWSVTSAPTGTQRDQYEYAAEAFEKVLSSLRAIVQDDLPELEDAIEEAGAPWTPGRLPEWHRED